MYLLFYILIVYILMQCCLYVCTVRLLLLQPKWAGKAKHSASCRAFLAQCLLLQQRRCAVLTQLWSTAVQQ